MPVPAAITLDAVTQGDKWEGIPTIGPCTLNESPMPWTATSATLIFKRVSGCLCDDLTAPVTIVDGVTWEFSVPPIPYADFDITQGRWEGDFVVTGDNGNRLTLARFTIPIGRSV